MTRNGINSYTIFKLYAEENWNNCPANNTAVFRFEYAFALMINEKSTEN